MFENLVINYNNMTHFLHTPHWNNQPSDTQRNVKASRIYFDLLFTDNNIDIDTKLTPQILSNFTEYMISQLLNYYNLQIKEVNSNKLNISKELRDIYEHNISVIREYIKR